MKKLITLFLSLAMVLSTSFFAFAATNETFKITETTTVGEAMRFTDPDQYYSYSKEVQERLNSININSSSSMTRFSSKNTNNMLAASLSSKASSPSKGKIKFSGTVRSNVICPDLSLTAIVYDSNGNVIRTYSTSRGSSKSVTLTGICSQLNSKEKYKVAFTGVIDPPEGYVPSPGVVTYTRTVTVK